MKLRNAEGVEDVLKSHITQTSVVTLIQKMSILALYNLRISFEVNQIKKHQMHFQIEMNGYVGMYSYITPSA